jgi:peroxin-11B
LSQQPVSDQVKERHRLHAPSPLTKSSTVGRDKTLRTIQYFSRFLAWYLYRTNHSQSTVDVFNGVKKNFGSVRKAMRLTKFIEHFKLAAVASDAKTSDPVVKYLAVGRQLGYAFYMLLDNMTYPDVAGIKKFSAAARLQKEAYRAWCVGLTCNVVAGLYALYNLRLAEQKQEDSADAEKAMEVKKLAKYVFALDCSIQPGQHANYRDCRDKSVAQLQLISDLCDLTVPTSGLGLLNLDDGIVGLAGTVSSLIGLYGVWQKTA